MKFVTPILLLTYLTTQILCIPTGVTVGLNPEFYHPIHTLYHSQDKLGQYSYGYATPSISRSEVKGTDGVTRGGYSYIDKHGQLQSVQYTADPVHGFRVAASNLPVESPDVAHARVAHLAEFSAIKAERDQIAANIAANVVPYSNPVAVPAASVPVLPEPVQDLPEVVAARAAHLAAVNAAYNGHLNGALPTPVIDLPEVAKAKAEHLASFRATLERDAQLRAAISLGPVPDHLDGNVVPVTTHGDGNSLPVAAPVASYEAEAVLLPYSYGYLGPHSSASESRAADGTVRGGYSFIDANGIVQTVHYIADAAGFRVAASNLPVDKNHGTAAASTRLSVGSPVAVEEKKVIVPALYSTDIAY